MHPTASTSSTTLLPPGSGLEATIDFAPTEAAQRTGTTVGGGSSTGRTTVVIAHRRAEAARAGLRFELVEELGRGGMGVVLRGRDPDLHRDVAVKLLRHTGDDRREARFIAEAQITGQLEHPNIIPVHEFGRDAEGRPWFAMKLIRGRTLADLLAARGKEPAEAQAWPLTRLLGILIQVCHAVAFAHSRGVIHRDLKPANIMLGDFGEVLVVDWGLGKAVGSAAEGASALDPMAEASSGAITIDGAIVGTPCYMPPEQARGELDRLGPHGDVYALGATLCEIIAGRPPVTGSTLSEVVRKACAGDATIPERDWQGYRVPRELVAILRRAMAFDPSARYPGCEALAADLQAWIEHRAVSVVDASLLEALGKFVRRHTLTTAVAGVASVVLVAMAVVGYGLKEQERAAAVAARAAAEDARERTVAALADAEQERRRVATGRQRERSLAGGAERQARRVERGRTLAVLAQADAALARSQGPVAASLLDEIPTEERDWTWRHLAARVAGVGLRTVAIADLRSVAPAGTGFVAVDGTGRARLLAATGTTRQDLDLPRPVAQVAASRDGRQVVVAFANGGHALIEGTSGRAIGSRLGGDPLRAVAIDDGRLLRATPRGLLGVGAEATAEVALPGVSALVLAPDLTWWAAAVPGGVVLQGSGATDRRLAMNEPVTHLSVSRDGLHLAALAGPRLRCWTAPGGALEADVLPGGDLTALAHGPGSTLAVGTARGDVLIWEVDLGLPSLRLTVGAGPVRHLTWSADGRTLAAASESGLTLWGE